MTQMTLDRPMSARYAEVPQRRVHAMESPLPQKPDPHGSCGPVCPHCQNLLPPQHPHTFQRLKSGVHQLLSAVLIIVFSVVRLARLVVAFAFSLVGLVGFGLQNVAKRVVHPNDQRLLPLRPRSRR